MGVQVMIEDDDDPVEKMIAKNVAEFKRNPYPRTPDSDKMDEILERLKDMPKEEFLAYWHQRIDDCPQSMVERLAKAISDRIGEHNPGGRFDQVLASVQHVVINRTTAQTAEDLNNKYFFLRSGHRQMGN
jgi:hypothetical protein